MGGGCMYKTRDKLIHSLHCITLGLYIYIINNN